MNLGICKQNEIVIHMKSTKSFVEHNLNRRLHFLWNILDDNLNGVVKIKTYTLCKHSYL